MKGSIWVGLEDGDRRVKTEILVSERWSGELMLSDIAEVV